MEALYLLIPLSLVLVSVVIWALLWAIRSGQFEDLEGPAHRLIMEDDDPVESPSDPSALDQNQEPPESCNLK